ncbi:aminotransferase class I/II-fold pyridoxal phosphate-dependent enzyme [Methylobacterium terricola]|uniref:Aminotransferase class I/II-fold pyridoxal phosphate-dependent enzyme n=1 Tax=Methylobacterium terricola TaxID=2583531 RepID=A0A5C4LQC0_9HYPH|nr:GntG family PLP-dependent aldolase [Methylobacterium terricola]TNC16353.1 aminotransferase class I/II-fold pyridoxal phosphate-dependent enzyme [Methylobacterium terricola]
MQSGRSGPHSDRPDVAPAESCIDLRSDTLTRPTPAMYTRIATAPLGDDGLGHDPTAKALEEAGARLLGKAAALYLPSCTMANLVATLCHAGRQEQVILEAQSHMYTAERGAATFTGTFPLAIAGTDGAMDLQRLADALRPGGSSLSTGMIGLETTHNNAGGTVPPLDHMRAVRAMALADGIPVHLDGARLLNAAVHLGVPACMIAAEVDSVSLCLSKGLSAPMGALLAGSAALVARARSLRKMLGGTQRQVGIAAAAGLEALATMGDRLGEDHARARRLGAGLNGLGPGLSASVPQTNIVQVDLSQSGCDSATWLDRLAAQGVLARPLGPWKLRLVTHRHIDDGAVEAAIRAFGACLPPR